VHINRLTLTNFGSFRNLTVAFPATGVSVISGPNASGKSQLIGAAIAAIVGPRVVSINRDGQGPSCIQLALADGGVEEIATLSVAVPTIASTSAAVHADVTHTSTPLAKALLDKLARGTPPRLIVEEGAGVDHLRGKDVKTFEAIAPPRLIEGDFWRRMRDGGWLDSGAHSAGVGVVIDIVREFIARSETEGLPFVVDGFFSQLDRQASEFCAELLRILGRRSQVIVVTPSFSEHSLGREVLLLPRQEEPIRTMAYYTPERLRKERSKIPVAVGGPRFKLGGKFPKPENRVCELKEVKGNNPVGSIGQVVDQYVVAFLNAGTDQTGSIFWGVKDSRDVVGVLLTDAQCDEIRRVVVEKVGSIMPPLAPSALNIEFHPVSSPNPVPLYVVEVRVPAAQGTYLYATGSEDVYVKTEAGKKKLTIMQIQQELLRRMTLRPAQ